MGPMFDLTALSCGDEILQVLSVSMLTLARSNSFCCTYDRSCLYTCSDIHWEKKSLILTLRFESFSFFSSEMYNSFNQEKEVSQFRQRIRKLKEFFF